ncbi:MAG: PAS domain-containing protein [Bacteroidota bacterium]|nr:PAS domain-containing protein [Bacteroidota bacterium]
MGDNLIHHTKYGKKAGESSYPNQSVSDAISNGFFTVDRDWTVKYWNKAAQKLVGIQSKDIVGKNLWDGFAKIVPIEFYDVLQHSFLKNRPDHFEEYLGKMGSWFDVIIYHCDNTVSVSFKSLSGAPGIEDLQLQLKVLNELYRFVTEVTNDCIWEWNLQTKEIFWVDGGHKRIFGYSIENALIPQSFWEDRVHPDDRTKVLAGINQIKSGGSGGSWEQEYRFKKADGEYVYVHDRGRIIYGREKGAMRMIGTTQEITARKSAEMQLVQERLTRQKEISYAVLTAQENERLEIGKDLNENLNQILGAAKLYIEMAKTYDEQRVEYLEKSSGYIVDVIEEIRAISIKLKMPGMRMGLFDSVQFLVDKLKTESPVKIEFQANGIDEEDLDETLQLDLFRIIQELTNNIVRHARATYAIVNLTRQRNEITLFVSDNGQGCDLLKVEMGMGMINILSHAEMYQGRVSTQSTPGNGYELTVVIPLNGRQIEQLNSPSDFDD